MVFSASSCLFLRGFSGNSPLQPSNCCGWNNASKFQNELSTHLSQPGGGASATPRFHQIHSVFHPLTKKCLQTSSNSFVPPRKNFVRFLKRPLLLVNALDAGTLQTFPQIQNRWFIAAASGDWFVGISSKPICISTVRISVFTYSNRWKSHHDNVEDLFWENCFLVWRCNMCKGDCYFCCKSCFDDTVRSYVETNKDLLHKLHLMKTTSLSLRIPRLVQRM